MKTIHLITILTIGSAAWILSSCCSKDKNCPAGNPSLGAFPYQYNQQLVFADSTGKSIRVQMNSGFEGSTEYGLDGSCSTPHKEISCQSSISLGHASITDSSGLLQSKDIRFSCSIEKVENAPAGYSLYAFGSVSFYIADYGRSNTVYNGVKLPVYSTPYKTYNNVYTNKTVTEPYMPGYKSRIVYAPNGALISFTLGSDTTHVFYLVE